MYDRSDCACNCVEHVAECVRVGRSNTFGDSFSIAFSVACARRKWYLIGCRKAKPSKLKSKFRLSSSCVSAVSLCMPSHRRSTYKARSRRKSEVCYATSEVSFCVCSCERDTSKTSHAKEKPGSNRGPGRSQHFVHLMGDAAKAQRRQPGKFWPSSTSSASSVNSSSVGSPPELYRLSP